MTHYRAADQIAGARVVKSPPGVRLHAGFQMEILGVDVEGIGCNTGAGAHRVFVGIQKISHIAQQTEVGVRHRVDQLFQTLAVLTELSVVFHHGLYADPGRKTRHLTAGVGKDRQTAVKATGAAKFPGIAEGGVVPHPGRAQKGGYLRLVLNSRYLRLNIAAAEEIRSHGMKNSLNVVSAFAIAGAFLRR